MKCIYLKEKNEGVEVSLWMVEKDGHENSREEDGEIAEAVFNATPRNP